MIDNLKVFEHRDFGKLTVIEKDSEFFFLGKEVATALGYKNTRKAILDHVDSDDKGVTKWNTQGGVQNLTIINESGLYSLVLSSKLSAAKKFKKWVTKEVLPSIRKNGGYILNQENKSREEILSDAILIAENIIKEKETKIKELEPKAIYFDRLVDKNLLTNFRNTAKELGISQKELIQKLIDKRLIYRDKHRKLLPYAKNNRGYFEVKEWLRDDGTVYGIHTLITSKGRKYLLSIDI